MVHDDGELVYRDIVLPHTPPERFLTWLQDQINEQQFSYRETARKAGLSSSMISLIFSGHMPNETTVRKLARLFRVDEAYVLHLAGYIRHNPLDVYDESIEELARRIQRLVDAGYGHQTTSLVDQVLVTIEQLAGIAHD